MNAKDAAAMHPEAFLASLDAQNREALDALGQKSAAAEPSAELSVPDLLMLALKNEYEATLLAATWLTDTAEVEVKLALARQCGDEAKHYRLIEKRLAELGRDLTAFDPAAPGPSPLLTYLLGLRGTAERVAAGQFTREAIAVVRNEVFATFCEQRGDSATAALYRNEIQPDERHHHELGRRLLLTYATTEALQASARDAAQRTLSIADELQELARLKKGVCRAPGC